MLDKEDECGVVGDSYWGKLPRRMSAVVEATTLEPLLNRAWCCVAGLSNHAIFHWFAFFIDDAKRFVRRGIHKLNLDATILTIARLVRRTVCQRILIAQRVGDGSEDVGELAIEAGEVCLAATLRGEGLHLIVGLEEVESRDWS